MIFELYSVINKGTIFYITGKHQDSAATICCIVIDKSTIYYISITTKVNCTRHTISRVISKITVYYISILHKSNNASGTMEGFVFTKITIYHISILKKVNCSTSIILCIVNVFNSQIFNGHAGSAYLKCPNI